MMRKILLLLPVCMLVVSLHAQRFVGAAIVGMNFTQVDGDEVVGFKKPGVNMGGSVMLSLNPKQTWFATVELLFSQKGAFQKGYISVGDSAYMHHVNIDTRYPFDDRVLYKLRLDYVEIPIVFHYEDPKTGCAFGAGLSWGRLVYAKEIDKGWRTMTDVRSGEYKKNDWSVFGDIKVRVWKGLKLNLRYQYSFIPLRERDFYDRDGEYTHSRKQYNNVLTFRIIYAFNEKYKLNYRVNKYGERVGSKWVRETREP